MSSSCKMFTAPLLSLSPQWVQFISTKGVLRVIRFEEDHHKLAQGMIFLCPRCKPDKTKQHHHIFLFDNAPIAARPYGRFKPKIIQNRFLVFGTQSLQESTTGSTYLCPQDTCGWKGYLQDGQVSWRPTWIERFKRK